MENRRSKRHIAKILQILNRALCQQLSQYFKISRQLNSEDWILLD